MKKPVVSIITPTYNHEKYIGYCIKSVLMQSFTEWEMIIVDDGSTDATVDVVRRNSDPRIKVIENGHQGIWKLFDTYNMALDMARGKYIAILEGDDAWPAYRLKKQLEAFNHRGVVLAYGRALMISEKGDAIGLDRSVPSKKGLRIYNSPPGAVLRLLLAKNIIPACTALIRREALERMGKFIQPPGYPSIDYPTFLNLALQGEFHYFDVPMGFWRRHLTQVTTEHYVDMVTGSQAYALEFFKTLDHEMKTLSGWTEPNLKKLSIRKKADGCFFTGRLSLMAGKHELANSCFTQAIQQGGLLTKIKSAMGLACSLTGVNLEGLLRKIGGVPLK